METGTQLEHDIWHFARFDDLTPREIHDVYQARVAVFVVEQNCPFQDVDGADPAMLAPARDTRRRIRRAPRLLPPRAAGREVRRALDRARAHDARRRAAAGAGRELMAEAVARAETLWPGQAIRIGAQRYLETFYGEFGFAQVSEPYDEDGILHIEMLRIGRGRTQ